MIVDSNELCLYCISVTANKADETVCAPSSQPTEADGGKQATVALIIMLKSYISKINVDPLKVFRDRARWMLKTDKGKHQAESALW